MPDLISEPGDLGPGLIVRVGAGGGMQIGGALLEEVERRCAEARAVLRRGDPVYGLNTGMGALAGVRLSEAEQLAHQRNLLLARATGGPPWLDPADARAIIAVRLPTFLSGDPGRAAGLCQRLVGRPRPGLAPAGPP